MRKWDKDDGIYNFSRHGSQLSLIFFLILAARIIVKERVTTAGGVPSMVMDLIETSMEINYLETLSCGGAPASDTMPRDVLKRFRKTVDACVPLVPILSVANGCMQRTRLRA